MVIKAIQQAQERGGTEMSETTTPETDAFYNGPCNKWVNIRQRAFARKFERERDEARLMILALKGELGHPVPEGVELPECAANVLCDTVARERDSKEMLLSISLTHRDLIMEERDKAEKERDEALSELVKVHMELSRLTNCCTTGKNWSTMLSVLQQQASKDYDELSRDRDRLRQVAEGLAKGLQRIESSDSTGNIYLDAACMRGIAREALAAFEEASGH
jgi:hypothetical protein